MRAFVVCLDEFHYVPDTTKKVLTYMYVTCPITVLYLLGLD